MSLKKATTLIFLAMLSLLLMAAEKADERTMKNIERNMERMKNPEKELKKLAISKLFLTQDFNKNISLIAREAQGLEKIKHPDEEFNKYSKELVAETAILLKAIKAKNQEDAGKSWENVKSICNDCHSAYKD
jgi:predicted transcriptional regulator